MTARHGRPALVLAGAFCWAAFFSGCSLLLLSGDSAFSGRFDRTRRVLVVVDERRAAVLADSLAQYRADLEADGIASSVSGWPGGTAADLRKALAAAWRGGGLDAALLVGDLPAAWYRRRGEGGLEEFPCDLYLMDPDASWLDGDGDGLLDGHSPLALKYAVSRLAGTDDELVRYFLKNHRFRAGETTVPAGALVFKDDSWASYKPGSGFGLSLVYDAVEILEAPDRTRRIDYAGSLSGAGFEFVYQWIHSFPSALCVQEGTTYNYFTTRDIEGVNPKGLFYDLYDCSAARFTENNLGMRYLSGTDHALAVFGSTKVGGCYRPLVFHQVLSGGGTWGDAYRYWYDYEGRSSDGWFLGMVILGDPALAVRFRGPIYRFVDWSLPAAPDETEVRALQRIDLDFSQGPAPGSFADYKKAHPEFFGR